MELYTKNFELYFSVCSVKNKNRVHSITVVFLTRTLCRTCDFFFFFQSQKLSGSSFPPGTPTGVISQHLNRFFLNCSIPDTHVHRQYLPFEETFLEWDSDGTSRDLTTGGGLWVLIRSPNIYVCIKNFIFTEVIRRTKWILRTKNFTIGSTWMTKVTFLLLNKFSDFLCKILF